MDEVTDPHLFAQAKRFRERWFADHRFRAAVEADPIAAAAAVGIDFDPTSVAFLWHRDVQVRADTPESRAFVQAANFSKSYFDFCNNDEGAIESYRVWRARQRARSAFAQGMVMPQVGLHLPFAVELTRGCSQRCWFCGVSAVPLEAVLPTDLESWEKMLLILRGVFGTSAVRGCLYWATDPLDHPDYEAYGGVFQRILGRFPVTTTAMHYVDFDRTRELIKIARAGNCPGLRFSIVSLRQLDRVYAAFTAEEMMDVDLALINRDSVLALADVGRARVKGNILSKRMDLERHKLSKIDDDRIHMHRTIACVSGFLIEPIMKRVRLISPEPCSNRWPDGYVVFDEEPFESIDEFARAINRLVEHNMQPDPPEYLALQKGVTVEPATPVKVIAKGGGWKMDFTTTGGRDISYLPTLANAFHNGAGVEETTRRIAGQFGIQARLVQDDVAELWRKGVLIELIFSSATDTIQ